MNPAPPLLRPVLFFLFVPVPTLFFGMCVDGRIGPGYGQSELGAAIAMMVISLLLVVLADRRPPGSLGLRLGLLAIRDFGIGIAIPTAQLGIIFGIEFAMGWVRPKGCSWDGDLLRMALWRWSGVALFEELACRGYLFQSLLTLGGRHLGPALALGITAVGFGWLHQLATPFATLALIVIGVELGVAYLVTRRLWLPIGMHFAWNLIEGTLLGFPVSGMSRPSLISIEQGGPEFWTGGSFGPEGSPVAIGLSLLDIAFLLWLGHIGFWRPDPFPREVEQAGSTSPAHRDQVGRSQENSRDV
jgi:uncharacterized protein